MARPCACCQHPQRNEIDAALIAGMPFRAIAATFDLRHAAIGRHAQNHLAVELSCTAQAHRTAVTPSASLQPVAPAEAITHKPPLSSDRRRALSLDLDGSAPASPAPASIPPPVEVPAGAYAASDAASGPFALAQPLSPYALACELRDSAVGILREAAASGDAKLALEANRTATGILDRLARLMPATDAAGTAPLLYSPQWLALRTALVAALADFPDARIAVANALAEAEGRSS